MTKKAGQPDLPEQETAAASAKYRRATLSIAAALGMSNLSAYIWLPFLPLYAMELGASKAEAAYWMAAAYSTMGIAMLISGPAWGWLSDRVGRKAMFLRALFFAVLTTLVVGVVNAPWQLMIALGIQGLFSGVIGTAVALTSVSVPDAKLKSSLSLVTGVQYLGVCLGPAIGAMLSLAIGYRGTCFVAAFLTAAVTTLVIFFVPTDRPPARASGAPRERASLEPLRPSLQLWLAVLIVLVLMLIMQLTRLTTPIVLQDFQPGDVSAISGVAFALSGLGSALGVFFVTARFFKLGHLRAALAVGSTLIGLSMLLLAFSTAVAPYILGFTLMSVLQGAMIPAANTLIAFNVPPGRRGTAFGIASGAQALSFIAGSSGAALFAATSFAAGYAALGALCTGLAALIWMVLREPRMNSQ